MQNIVAFSADKIFTGEDWLTDKVVLTNDNIIQDIISTSDVPENISVKRFDDGFLTPAFIDLQIYGAYGNLLAVQPTIKTLQKIYDYCKSGGAKYFLPTVATNTYEVIYSCINAVKAYWQQGGEGVLGLHIEGPWISKAKRGAHIESLIHSPDLKEVRELLDYGGDAIKIITLAPEVCSAEIIDLIHSYNVIISAGHSNANYNQATSAFNNGIKTATHLYNAMSALQHREAGVVGAILNHSGVMASIIPDGYHVGFAAVSIAKKIMGDRLFIITDAVTETNEGLYPHKLEGDKYVSEGILSGSALTMLKAVKNCVEYIGIELGEALRMASLYPAQVIGMDKQLGRIKKGYKADFVAIDDNLELQDLK